MKPTLLSLTAALAIATGAALSVPVDFGGRVEAQRRGPSRADLVYVMKAGASDLYEIQSADLALRRARRPGVREFAQMLARDHRETTALVTAAARRDGLSPRPPMLEPRQRMMLRQLERARPGEFDRLYLGQQIPAHQQALMLHRNQARRGDGRQLRQVAAGAVPVVEHHLVQARQLSRSR